MNVDIRLRKVTELLHTIFCRRKHETNMINLDTSHKCCYYLEQSIEGTWECKDHQLWLEQAEVFMQLSKADSISALEHFTTIFRAIEALRDINPLYLKYVRVMMKGDLDDI